MFKKLLTSALFIFAASAANATLIGDDVFIELHDSNANTGGVQNHIVGPGEEGNYFGNQFFDFDAFSFEIRSTSTFCGMWTCDPADTVYLTLTSLDMGAPITGVNMVTSLSGVNVAFGANWVEFSWFDQGLTPTTYLQADFLTTEIPVPASLALMGIGLIALRLRK